MATQLDVNGALSTIPERKRSLSKTFSVLESQRNSLIKRPYDWKELDDHFTDVEKALRKKYEELLDKEKALEAKKHDIRTVMEKKEAAIAEAEQVSLARVQEQKDAAIAVILDHKRKWAEERQRLEREYGITAAKPDAVDDAPALDTEPTKVPVSPAKIMEVEMEDAFVENVEEGKEVHTFSKDAVEARPELRAICENSDSIGLKNFVVDNRTDAPAIRSELSAALKCAADPARLVLNALGSFLPSDKKDPATVNNLRACLLLIEALADRLAVPGHSLVSADIKQEAKIMANRWKSKINTAADSAGSFDVQNFLQIVITFGLSSEYDESELLRSIAAIARRKQAPSICRSLGLTPRIPDLVDQLIKDSKFIEAVFLANAFSLLDRFEPVPLLRSHLKQSEKATQAALQSRNKGVKAQRKVINKEISALKSVLRCIDEYKLEAELSSADLHKRVAELEKLKEDKKSPKEDKQSTIELEKSKEEKRNAELEKSKEDKKRNGELEKSKEEKRNAELEKSKEDAKGTDELEKSNDNKKRTAELQKSKEDEKRTDEPEKSNVNKKKTAELGKSKEDKKRSVASANTPAKKPRTNNSTVPNEMPLHHVGGLSSFGMTVRPGCDRPFHAGYGSRFVAGNPTTLPRPCLAGSNMYGSPAYMNPPSAYGSYPYRPGIPPYPRPYMR